MSASHISEPVSDSHMSVSGSTSGTVIESRFSILSGKYDICWDDIVPLAVLAAGKYGEEIAKIAQQALSALKIKAENEEEKAANRESPSEGCLSNPYSNQELQNDFWVFSNDLLKELGLYENQKIRNFVLNILDDTNPKVRRLVAMIEDRRQNAGGDSVSRALDKLLIKDIDYIRKEFLRFFVIKIITMKTLSEKEKDFKFTLFFNKLQEYERGKFLFYPSEKDDAFILDKSEPLISEICQALIEQNEAALLKSLLEKEKFGINLERLLRLVFKSKESNESVLRTVIDGITQKIPDREEELIKKAFEWSIMYKKKNLLKYLLEKYKKDEGGIIDLIIMGFDRIDYGYCRRFGCVQDGESEMLGILLKLTSIDKKALLDKAKAKIGERIDDIILRLHYDYAVHKITPHETSSSSFWHYCNVS